MKSMTLILGAVLAIAPAAMALAQENLVPAIGADNTHESRQIEAGHAVRPHSSRTHKPAQTAMRQPTHAAAHRTGSATGTPHVDSAK